MARISFLVFFLFPSLLAASRIGARVVPASVMLIRTTNLAALPDPAAVLASGSGVIIHPAGYLVTSSHLLGAGRLYAYLPDPDRPYDPPRRRLYLLRIVRRDRTSDLALLCIIRYRVGGHFRPLPAGKVFPHAPLGKTGRLEVLDPLYSFGFPVLSRLEGELRSGLIGIAGRVSGWDRRRGWLKAMLPVSPGHSGGAVVDRRGLLVGIVTAVRLDRETGARFTLIRPVELVRRLCRGTLIDPVRRGVRE